MMFEDFQHPNDGTVLPEDEIRRPLGRPGHAPMELAGYWKTAGGNIVAVKAQLFTPEALAQFSEEIDGMIARAQFVPSMDTYVLNLSVLMPEGELHGTGPGSGTVE
jgi:hypothetical protein